MERLTLEQIEAMDTEILTCAQVAPLLQADPNTIRGQAQDRPDLLGFPVICAGRRVKIPRRPFIRFMREGIVDDKRTL